MIFENYPRSEQSIFTAMAAMVPEGISTRKYRGCLIKTKINEAINYFLDEASGYL